MTKGAIPILLLILLLGIGIGVVTGDDITLGITYSPSNTLFTEDQITIKVTVSNQSGPMPGNQVNFEFDNSKIGVFSPPSLFTNEAGEAFSTFYATSSGGFGNLTVRVHYWDGGIFSNKTGTGVIQVIPYPDEIILDTRDLTNDTHKEWLTANGNDKSRISLFARNTTDNYLIPNLRVEFSLNNSEMGNLATTTASTDTNGRANSVFTTKTKSGNATIHAKTFFKGIPVEKEIIQRIDHNVPYRIDAIYYPNEASVGTIIPINVHLVDQYNNPIDNLNLLKIQWESVIFTLLGSPGEHAGFLDNETMIQNIEKSVDNTGNVTVDFVLDIIPGNHLIYIDPQSSAPGQTISIRGIADGVPEVIDLRVNPSVLYQPADGNEKSYFTLTYTVFDKFGNRLNNKRLNIQTSLGQSYFLDTTYDGKATLAYGPRDYLDIVYGIIVTANSDENVNATTSTTLDFYDPRPVRFSLNAVPETIPSRDVGTNVTGTIYAKITDEKGKPVSDQSVNFILLHPDDYPPEQIVPPYLINHINNATTNTTDVNGLATALFVPGTFDNSNTVASASAVVKGEWFRQKDSTWVDDEVNLSWKNFPFLSVYTSTSNFSGQVGDTVDVTIQLKGEGLAVEWRKPMDVILSTSRTWTMLDENPDKMVYTYIAENLFIDRISQSRPMGGSDHLGLLTFGGNPNGVANINDMWKIWKDNVYIDNDDVGDSEYIQNNYIGNNQIVYRDWVTWEVPFTSQASAIKAAINNTTPWDNKEFSTKPTTAVRKVVYDGITALRNESNSIKAMVLLVDSEITIYGDVLAEGSYTYEYLKLNGGTNQYYPFLGPDPDHPWNRDKNVEPQQNMAIYARNNNVKIFVVYTAAKLNDADYTTLSTLATTTGGAFIRAQNGAELASIYDWIATQLIKEAAMDTQMIVDMGVVEVNGDPVNQTETLVFDYVYEPDVSTRIRNYYTNGTVLEQTTINQTEDYAPDHRLTFTVGTINVNQIWEATYRLKVLVPGNVNLFGNQSNITFTNPLIGDTDVTFDLGNLFFYSHPSQNLQEPTADLDILQFACVNCNGDILNDPNEVRLGWDIFYNGNKTVNERIYYKKVGSSEGWKIVESSNLITGITRFSTWNLENGYYDFRIEASAQDAPRKIKEGVRIFIEKKPFYILLR